MTHTTGDIQNKLQEIEIKKQIESMLVSLMNKGTPILSKTAINSLYAVYRTALTQIVEETEKKTAKAYGGCTNCYGKGYSTSVGSIEASKTAFPMIDYCNCDRGKQLRSHLQTVISEIKGK
jgi:hypothetical protein